MSSRLEGGANVVSEAIVLGVPVLASNIPGNVGMLGADYPGYYTCGDAKALARLMGRAESEPALSNIDQPSREFRRRFDLMSLQRNLKALGTFGYQTTTRRNPVYIQYMPRTLRYVRTNLEKYGRFARLRELLAVHIEELQ